jgi:hypothetical protein
VFVPKVGAWRCDTLAEAEEIASEHERGTCVWHHRLGAFDADKDALINPTIERRLAFVWGVFLFSPICERSKAGPRPPGRPEAASSNSSDPPLERWQR